MDAIHTIGAHIFGSATAKSAQGSRVFEAPSWDSLSLRMGWDGVGGKRGGWRINDSQILNTLKNFYRVEMDLRRANLGLLSTELLRALEITSPSIYVLALPERGSPSSVHTTPSGIRKKIHLFKRRKYTCARDFCDD